MFSLYAKDSVAHSEQKHFANLWRGIMKNPDCALLSLISSVDHKKCIISTKSNPVWFPWEVLMVFDSDAEKMKPGAWISSWRCSNNNNICDIWIAAGQARPPVCYPEVFNVLSVRILKANRHSQIVLRENHGSRSAVRANTAELYVRQSQVVALWITDASSLSPRA